MVRADTLLEQPPKRPPKFYQLLIKTHKLTIALTVPQHATIALLKQEALSALTSEVNTLEEVPKVKREEDFEICKGKRGKTKDNALEYVPMDRSLAVESLLSNWETVFLQFRNESGEFIIYSQLTAFFLLSKWRRSTAACRSHTTTFDIR